MKKKICPQMVEDGEAMFLEAMRHGWAAGNARGNRTVFEKGEWRVEDEWVGNNGYGAGWTREFLWNKPFWQMSYQGYYPKSLIPYVQRGLRYHYERGIFLAGRGPRRMEISVPDGFVVYRNNPQKVDGAEEPGAFTNFAGQETIERFIFDRSGSGGQPMHGERGYHRVQGMRLQFV